MRSKLLYIIMILVIQACAFIEGPDELNQDFGWEKEESESYLFYYRADSEAEKDIDKIVSEQEDIISELRAFLDVGYREKIHVYIFNDLDDSGFDNNSGHAITIMNAIEVIYGNDGYTIGKQGVSAHEVTHILTYNGWGTTNIKLLSEGISVAMESLWEYKKNEDLFCFEDEACKNGFNENIPTIESLVNDFSSYPSRKAYALSGAFVGYLVHSFGMDKFCEFFTYANKGSFSSDFGDIFNISLEKVEKDWNEYLESATDKVRS